MSDFFPEQQVIVLKSANFRLDTDDSITTTHKAPSIILFLDHSETSRKLSKIWINLSKTVAGVMFCACDLIEEKEIALAFTVLADDKTSPYSKFANQPPPFIILYREGRPQKLYLGVFDECHIRPWALKVITNSNRKIIINDEECKIINDDESNSKYIPTRA